MSTTQRDIDLYTSREEMEADGWKFIGTQKDPRWSREISPGKTEYFNRNPEGFNRKQGLRQGNGSPAVNRIVMSRLVRDGIAKIIDESFDGREVGAMMLCQRDGDTITLIESAPDGIGDVRYSDAMKVYDSRAEAMEDHRLAAGIPHYAASMWHTHPNGQAKLSEADIFAFKHRARDEIGGVFAAVILARSEGSEGFDVVKGFIVDKAGRSYSVPIEAE